MSSWTQHQYQCQIKKFRTRNINKTLWFYYFKITPLFCSFVVCQMYVSMRVIILRKKSMLVFLFLSLFVELCTFFIDYQSTLVVVVTICRVMFFFFIGYRGILVVVFFKYCTYSPYVLFFLGNWYFGFSIFLKYCTYNPYLLFYLVI